MREKNPKLILLRMVGKLQSEEGSAEDQQLEGYQDLIDRIQEDLDDDEVGIVDRQLRVIGGYMIKKIDRDGNSLMSQDEVDRFRRLIQISGVTTVDNAEEASGRRKTVSFADLRREGLLEEGEVRIVFCHIKDGKSGFNGRKAYLHFGGVRHRVTPIVQGGKSREGLVSLRELTDKYADLGYTPADWQAYWQVEGTEETLADLVSRYRAIVTDA